MNFKSLVIQRFTEFQTLFLWSCLTLVLLLFRIRLSGSFHFLFLVWNFFLAWIPYGMTVMFQTMPVFYVNKLLRWPVLLLWLLFLPNAPYIITDFMHLHYVNLVQWLFDFILIGSFAGLGFVLGLFSLRDIQNLLLNHYHSKIVKPLIGTLCFLSGYGIYIGRITRLNSWDAFFRPQLTLEVCLESLHDPLAWVMTFGFGGVLLTGDYLLNKRKRCSFPST